MADGVFNIAKGAAAEKFRDGAANGLILLLTTSETEATLVDYDTVAALLAGTPVEASDGTYARKTGLTGTITVDDTNNRVDVDIPDQTWTGLDNDVIVKAVVAYEESAADSGRIPLTHHDFAISADGSDVTLEVNASGIFRAA